MRKVFYILSMLLVVACSSTQNIKNVPEIKNVNATFDDYLSLFNAAGYAVDSARRVQICQINPGFIGL